MTTAELSKQPADDFYTYEGVMDLAFRHHKFATLSLQYENLPCLAVTRMGVNHKLFKSFFPLELIRVRMNSYI